LTLGFRDLQRDSIKIGKDQDFLFDWIAEPGAIDAKLAFILYLVPELLCWDRFAAFHSRLNCGIARALGEANRRKHTRQDRVSGCYLHNLLLSCTCRGARQSVAATRQ
jgi:hypothetical protein